MSTSERRIHQVCASAISEGEGSSSFEEWDRRALQLRNYARKLGFAVMHENVDRAEPGYSITEIPRKKG